MSNYQPGPPHWPGPTPWDVMTNLSERLAEQGQQMGGLLTGQKMTLQALEHMDDRITAGFKEVHDRITAVEVKHARGAPSLNGQPPEARRGSLTALKDLAVALKDLIITLMPLKSLLWVVAAIVAGLFGIVAPGEIKGAVRGFLHLPPAPITQPAITE